MKRLAKILCIIILMYLVISVCDYMTTPLTLEVEREEASHYLAESNLPTPPRTFAHDGCTLFPDVLLSHDFYQACLNHDIGYWAGGSKEQRDAVDLTFYNQLKDTGPLGSLFFAPVMYTAVHYFGNNWLSHKMGSNWGFGWNT